MLSNEEQVLQALLRASLTNTDVGELQRDINAQTLAQAIRKGGVLTTVYPSLKAYPEAQDALAKEYYASISQHVTQQHEGRRILDALSAAGMDCMAMKGWEICKLYPNAFMRQMSDVDVLIRPYDANRVAGVLEGLGYAQNKEEGSLWKRGSFKKGPVHVETFRCLSDDNGPTQAWEAGVWGNATHLRNNVWQMSAEDVFVHHIVHLHKDFGNGIFGLRRIADTWLLGRKLDDMNMSYVQGQLEAMGLQTFSERMLQLARVFMGEDPSDPSMEMLLEFAFRQGIYSTGKTDKIGRAAAMPSKSGILGKAAPVLHAVFLPYGKMAARYPRLKQYPALLPVYWVRRVADYVSSRDLKRVRSAIDYSHVPQQEIDHMRAMMDAAGWQRQG